MDLNRELLQAAREARDRGLDLQHDADQAQVGYQHAIRRLHAAGASLREIAGALGLSYQRVHQIVDVTSGKGAVKECRTDRACSFCGQGQASAGRLIAGPGVLICNSCVELASRVLASDHERSNPWTDLEVETEPRARCNFCGKRPGDVMGLAVAPRRSSTGKFGLGPRRFARHPSGVRVCSECLSLCTDILADQLG